MTAAVAELQKAPTRTGTLSRSISFWAALTELAGRHWPSSITSSIFLPRTPPAAFCLGDGQLGAVDEGQAVVGDRAGQGLDDADLDRLLRLGGAQGAEEERGHEGGTMELAHLHLQITGLRVGAGARPVGR